MKFDGPKRYGRFIKRDSPVIEKISLIDFSFKEICATPIVDHDNPDRTIIHTRFHDEQRIDSGLKSPEKFEADLMPDSQRRIVLRPLDFTHDWEKERRRIKEGLARNYDEDEDDLVFEAPPPPNPTENPVAQDSESYPAEEAEKTDAKEADDAAAAPETEPRNYQSMEIVGKAIQDLMQGEDVAPDPPEEEVRAPAEGEERKVSEPSEFIPVPTVSEDGSTFNPETPASESYKQKVEENAEANQQAAEEARAKGYEEGFKHGEEKAEVQVRQKAQTMFGKVGALVSEFEALKKEVLKNVQENFYEITQAVAETLIGKELQMQPDSFAKVLRKAIDEAVAPDKFTIRLHPETFAQVQELDLADISQSLVQDSDVEPGDFKIESDLSIVDGNVKNLIRELLDQANLTLFESEDKAG